MKKSLQQPKHKFLKKKIELRKTKGAKKNENAKRSELTM